MLVDLLQGFEVLSTTEETLFNSRNMELLLAYKQEATCRARWLTTASGCRHLLIFNVCRLDKREPTKLIRLISYVVSVYIPSFGTIQLKPSAAEGPGNHAFSTQSFACTQRN